MKNLSLDKDLAFAAMGVRGGDHTGEQYEKKQSDLQEQGRSSGGGASSWNDLKDRPFYEEVHKETVLFDGTVDSDCDVDCGSLAVGREYTVTLDGAKYILTAWDGDGFAVIGSESLWNGDDYVDTEPPFVLGDCWFYTVKEGDEHTLKLVGDTVEVHRIDEKYLPASYATNIIDPSAYSLTMFSHHHDTNYAFEQFGDGYANEFNNFCDVIRWSDTHNTVFYDFEKGCSWRIHLDPPSEYTNNYSAISCETVFSTISGSDIIRLEMHYTWYVDDDGVLWGNCVYRRDVAT